MGKTFALFCLGLLAVCALSAPAQADMVLTVPGLVVLDQPLKPKLIAFYDMAENPYKLRDFRGQVVIVNLWNTRCVPCIGDLKNLSQLQKKLGPEGLRVITIGLDEDTAKIPEQLQKLSIRNLVPYGDLRRNVGKNWQPAALPASYIINGNGEVTAQISGPAKWDSLAMARFLRTELQQNQIKNQTILSY